MKGLLLNDLYATKAYFRSFLFLMAVFLIMPFFSENSSFFIYYPCIFAGVLAMSLIAYEEREKWNVYSLTLPFSRAQLVSSKYLISLLFGLSAFVATLIVQSANMLIHSNFQIYVLLSLAISMIPLILIPNALLLPFIYKLGAEKGRIAYYFILGGFVALIGIMSGFQMFSDVQAPTPDMGIIGGADGPTEIFVELTFFKTQFVIVLISIAVYTLSWLLSIKIYKKREL